MLKNQEVKLLKMNIERRHSEHFDERADDVPPSIIVLHYTEVEEVSCVDDIFMGKHVVEGVGRVSAHYVIDQQGRAVQYVDESKRAWHAGKSYWNGITDLNSHSIGIELVHAGHKALDLSYPDLQIQSLIELCKAIAARYDIKPWDIVGHSDIAPERKVDPGEFFPWDVLSIQNLGLYHLFEHDLEQEQEYDQDLYDLLMGYGYDPDAPKDLVIKAFAAHFAKGQLDDQQLKLIAQKLMRLKSL